MERSLMKLNADLDKFIEETKKMVAGKDKTNSKKLWEKIKKKLLKGEDEKFAKSLEKLRKEYSNKCKLLEPDLKKLEESYNDYDECVRRGENAPKEKTCSDMIGEIGKLNAKIKKKVPVLIKIIGKLKKEFKKFKTVLKKQKAKKDKKFGVKGLEMATEEGIKSIQSDIKKLKAYSSELEEMKKMKNYLNRTPKK